MGSIPSVSFQSAAALLTTSSRAYASRITSDRNRKVTNTVDRENYCRTSTSNAPLPVELRTSVHSAILNRVRPHVRHVPEIERHFAPGPPNKWARLGGVIQSVCELMDVHGAQFGFVFKGTSRTKLTLPARRTNTLQRIPSFHPQQSFATFLCGICVQLGSLPLYCTQHHL